MKKEKLLFVVTSRSLDGLEKEIVAIKEGLSRDQVFDTLKPMLERVAIKLGEKLYIKEWNAWGIGNTLFSVEGVTKVITEQELEECLLRTFI